MDPLVTNRQCLICLRILPADETASRRQRLAHSIFAGAVLIGLACGMTACLAFCWKFASIDLGRSIFAFLFVIGEFTFTYMALVGMILLRHKIGSIFENLKAIYKASE